MSSPSGGRVPRWVSSVHAVDAATSLVRAEAVRLELELQTGISALSLIQERAKTEFHRSARVASLGLDVLPPGYYLDHCVSDLRTELRAVRLVGRPLRRARERVEELRELLQRVVDVTAGVDLAGELDLPLELVSTAQSGARAGISSLDRMMRTIVDLERGPRSSSQRDVDGVRPTPVAQWLLNAGSAVLPTSGRERYAEEFRGELFSLADSGAGWVAQLAYVARQVVRLWSLRRVLPSAPATETGRRAAVQFDRGAVARTFVLDSLRARSDHRLARLLLRRRPPAPKRRPVFRRGERGAQGLAQAGGPSYASVDLPTPRPPGRHRRDG